MDNKFLFVGSIIGGCIAVMVVIFNLVYAPLSDAICSEVQARCASEAELRKDVNSKLDTLLVYAMDSKSSIASFSRQVDINTRRIDKLENGAR